MQTTGAAVKTHLSRSVHHMNRIISANIINTKAASQMLVSPLNDNSVPNGWLLLPVTYSTLSTPFDSH